MVEMAQAAAQPGNFIAGDIGPTGEMLAPYGLISFDEAVTNFAVQAGYLEKAGVDLFIIETMFDLNEALAAIQGVRQVTQKPVFATLTFEENRRIRHSDG
jgi:5-methyltetrahydrofolate--homocysteine methyltransferase